MSGVAVCSTIHIIIIIVCVCVCVCVCVWCRLKANLQYCAEVIPTLSTQLRIIASVKASTPNDTSVSHLV